MTTTPASRKRGTHSREIWRDVAKIAASMSDGTPSSFSSAMVVPLKAMPRPTEPSEANSRSDDSGVCHSVITSSVVRPTRPVAPTIAKRTAFTACPSSPAIVRWK